MLKKLLGVTLAALVAFGAMGCRVDADEGETTVSPAPVKVESGDSVD